MTHRVRSFHNENLIKSALHCVPGVPGDAGRRRTFNHPTPNFVPLIRKLAKASMIYGELTFFGRLLNCFKKIMIHPITIFIETVPERDSL